jgi:hypothetical protein
MWQTNFSYDSAKPSELLKGVNFNRMSGGKSRRVKRASKKRASKKRGYSSKKYGILGFFMNKCGCKTRRRRNRR